MRGQDHYCPGNVGRNFDKRLIYWDEAPALACHRLELRFGLARGFELFFKWIKQHLRIRSFFGASENAVKTQIWIAVAVYALIAIVKKRLALDASLYTILQMVSVTTFEKTPLNQLLDPGPNPNQTRQSSNQLNLFND